MVSAGAPAGKPRGCVKRWRWRVYFSSKTPHSKRERTVCAARSLSRSICDEGEEGARMYRLYMAISFSLWGEVSRKCVSGCWFSASGKEEDKVRSKEWAEVGQKPQSKEPKGIRGWVEERVRA